MVDTNIGFRRIWHDGHDGNRAKIHVECEDNIVDGYEGWAIIGTKRHKVFYMAGGNTWMTEDQKRSWYHQEREW